MLEGDGSSVDGRCASGCCTCVRVEVIQLAGRARLVDGTRRIRGLDEDSICSADPATWWIVHWREEMRCRITFSLGASFAGLILEHGVVDSLEKLHLVLVRVHSVITTTSFIGYKNAAMRRY